MDCSHNSSSVCFLCMCYRSILVTHIHIEHLLVATGEVGLHTGTVFVLCFVFLFTKKRFAFQSIMNDDFTTDDWGRLKINN